MSIKVGDKIRIKMEEELLAEGWCLEERRYIKGDKWFWVSLRDYEFYVRNIEIDGWIEATDGAMMPCEVVEVVPQTLDEYICGLSLEERAEKFILVIPYARLYTIEQQFYSAITVQKYDTYDEALQATIKALKGEKENDN